MSASEISIEILVVSLILLAMLFILTRVVCPKLDRIIKLLEDRKP